MMEGKSVGRGRIRFVPIHGLIQNNNWECRASQLIQPERELRGFHVRDSVTNHDSLRRANSGVGPPFNCSIQAAHSLLSFATQKACFPSLRSVSNARINPRRAQPFNLHQGNTMKRMLSARPVE
jgi:hypothetical protein